MHAAMMASVEAVDRRLPMTVIGALTHGPCPRDASVPRSCPTGRCTVIGGRLSCDPTEAAKQIAHAPKIAQAGRTAHVPYIACTGNGARIYNQGSIQWSTIRKANSAIR